MSIPAKSATSDMPQPGMPSLSATAEKIVRSKIEELVPLLVEKKTAAIREELLDELMRLFTTDEIIDRVSARSKFFGGLSRVERIGAAAVDFTPSGTPSASTTVALQLQKSEFFDSIASMRLWSGSITNGTFAFVTNYYAGIAGGGGLFQWNSASTATENGGTVIVPTGQGATGRFLRLYDAHQFSAKVFGAKGDDSTDDLTKLQALFDAALIAAGKRITFQSGTYKITDALTIGLSEGFVIAGESVGGSIIKQYTSNKQIFKLTNCDTNGFEIRDLGFEYSVAQTSSQTNSIAIYFDGSVGTTANGLYNFQINRCKFTNFFRAIAGNAGIQLPVWGVCVRDCRFFFGSGACVYINPSPSVGIPNVLLENLYIRADNNTEQVVLVNVCQCVTLINVETNLGTVQSGRPQLHFTSCEAVTLIGCRAEQVTIGDNAGVGIWTFASSRAKIISADFRGINYAVSAFGLAVVADSNSSVSVHGLDATLGTIGGGATSALFDGAGFGIVDDYRWVGTAGTFTFYVTAAAKKVITTDRVSADNGDAAKTLVAGTDLTTQRWATALTANRAVGLSTVAGPLWNGAEFEIIRTAAATGASTLDVGTGPLKSLAVGQWCRVKYNGAAWMLSAFGSL